MRFPRSAGNGSAYAEIIPDRDWFTEALIHACYKITWLVLAHERLDRQIWKKFVLEEWPIGSEVVDMRKIRWIINNLMFLKYRVAVSIEVESSPPFHGFFPGSKKIFKVIEIKKLELLYLTFFSFEVNKVELFCI